jgi:LAS superfamily LD-carboxypeptidase LdcB
VALADGQLTGQDESHLCATGLGETLGGRLHVDVVDDFLALKAEAAREGFDLAIHSAFRGFDRQRSIWNRKVSGELAVLDSTAQPIDIATLDATGLVYAILRWSALPGASRHHWGTDLDVYDAASTPPGYELQLIPAEVDPGGMHGALHAWLDARIATGTAFGFHRPYDVDRGGVAPERWHLSHAPVASRCEARLSVGVLQQAIVGAGLLLEDTVLDHLNDIYVRFVTNVSHRSA